MLSMGHPALLYPRGHILRRHITLRHHSDGEVLKNCVVMILAYQRWCDPTAHHCTMYMQCPHGQTGCTGSD